MRVPPEAKGDPDTTWRAIAEARAARAEFKAVRAKLAETAAEARARVRACSEEFRAARGRQPSRDKS